jgi:polyisoprenyl-phosphate glycosyltransferase
MLKKLKGYQMNLTMISIVLPVYNEEQIIEKLAEEVEKHMPYQVEFVFVNDGSTDNTLEVIKNYKVKTKNCKKIVDLSRNFGHQQALMAGLTSVSEKAELILVMDADFQDAPEDIPVLINKLAEGYDCVYAERTANSGSNLVNMMTKLFYEIQQKVMTFSIPQNAGTFSIFNRAVLNKILAFSENEIYFPGIRAYVGMKQTGITVRRGKRAHGQSHVGKLGLINLSLVGLLGFSAFPMRVIFLFGLIVTLICFFLGFIVFLMKIFGITQIPGVTTILIFLFGLSGIQCIFIGAVGEYVGKLLLESKKRPRWVVREIINDK